MIWPTILVPSAKMGASFGIFWPFLITIYGGTGEGSAGYGMGAGTGYSELREVFRLSPHHGLSRDRIFIAKCERVVSEGASRVLLGREVLVEGGLEAKLGGGSLTRLLWNGVVWTAGCLGEWSAEKRLVFTAFACWPRGQDEQLIRTSGIAGMWFKPQVTGLFLCL